MCVPGLDWHDGLLLGTARGIDTDREAAALFFMIQGLIGRILIGVLSAAEALGLVDHQLDRIFR